MYDCNHFISCCKDCKDRCVGCHSKCEIYIKQIEEWKEIKKKIGILKPNIICNSDFNSYVGKRTKRYVVKRI